MTGKFPVGFCNCSIHRNVSCCCTHSLQCWKGANNTQQMLRGSRGHGSRCCYESIEHQVQNEVFCKGYIFFFKLLVLCTHGIRNCTKLPALWKVCNSVTFLLERLCIEWKSEELDNNNNQVSSVQNEKYWDKIFF